MLQCPHCNKAIPLALFTAHLGSLSKGKTPMTSRSRYRTSTLSSGWRLRLSGQGA